MPRGKIAIPGEALDGTVETLWKTLMEQMEAEASSLPYTGNQSIFLQLLASMSLGRFIDYDATLRLLENYVEIVS